MRPDWMLPPGVNRALWDYAHNEPLAQNYDASLAGSSLFRLDIDFVREWAGAPGHLLDLGCGTGRLMSIMAAEGWRCVGMDLSAAMLAVARDKTAGLPVHLLRGNITQLESLAPHRFDVVACLFSTLGMVTPSTERRRVLAGVRRVLRPGGRFLVHVHNRWFHLWDPAGRTWLRQGSGDKVMPAHHGVNGLTLHQFTRGEIKELLISEGFSLKEVRPVSLAADGRMPLPWLVPQFRAYGYLIAASTV